VWTPKSILKKKKHPENTGGLLHKTPLSNLGGSELSSSFFLAVFEVMVVGKPSRWGDISSNPETIANVNGCFCFP